MKKVAVLAAILLASASAAHAETYAELLDKSSKAIVAEKYRTGLTYSRELVALPYLTRAQQSVANTHLCINLSQMGRTADALRACNAAIALDDKAWGAYVNRGNVLSARGYRIGARADYRKAKELSPTTTTIDFASAMQDETPYVLIRPTGNGNAQTAQGQQFLAE